VCRALEGVPLAIELAASRADVVSPQAMVAELKQRLDFCRRNDPRLPPRHRSLRAAIDWSYEFLPVALREFFENLSVFRGGFTGEAAAAVAQSGALVATAGDPRRALSELRSASLVRVDTAHAGMRFALIETIREYAAEKLALRSDAPEIAEKHARFFMELTKQVEKHTGTPEEPEWRARLYAEAENLRAAMESDAEVETLATLVRDLPGDWPTEGRSAEYLRWVETCLRREDGLSEKPRAYLNSTAGQAYTALGDYARGRLYHEKALRFYRSVHDDSNIAGALCNLARIDVGEGDFASAEARTADGALLFERIGETAKAAQAFANLGGILCFQGQFDRARAAFEKSLTLLGESAALGVRSLIECGLAEIAFFAGDYRSANARALEGLALAVSVRDVHGLAEASTLLACISFADGRQGEAARWLGALDALSVVIEEVASKPLLGALHSVRQGLPASLAELAEETAAGKRMARKWTARRFS
jgi:tetratricopeptide (TPR) repeat protein